MQSQNCAQCNFLGEIKQNELYCYYWREWRVKGKNDTCEKWQKFTEQNKKMRHRLAMEERRQDEESKKIRSMAKNDNLFSTILLEKEQQDLLATIVEAARNVPPEKRQEFYVFRSSMGDQLGHDGLPEGEVSFYYSDIDFLVKEGLIHVLSYNQYGISKFDINPRGLLYYKYLKEKSGEPIENIEKTVHNYIDTRDFQKEYSKAYEKWVEAESLLWETDTAKQLTTIGHLCREAIQEFMDTLYTKTNSTDKSIPKDKTKNRLEKIIEVKSPQLGKTEREFLDGLYEYWEVMNNLIQKQEHGAQKEKSQLIWKDGRRVVFHTMMLMFEVSQSFKV